MESIKIHHNSRWMQNGVTVAGGNGEGDGLNQLNYPIGIYADDDQTIYVADTDNHRVTKWRNGTSIGEIVAGGNERGSGTNQLKRPMHLTLDKEKNYLIICDFDNRRVVRWLRQNGTNGETIISNIDCCRVTVDKSGYIYVSDHIKHEVRQWKIGDTVGTLVAGGNGQGNSLNQLNGPSSIFIDKDDSIYVSDFQNDRVMKWGKGAKEGIVVAGGQGRGNNLNQFSGPDGLIVDDLGTIYVVDCNNHRIMRWYKGSTEGNIIVGGKYAGEHAHLLHHPYTLAVDQQWNFYVADQENHRVQRFDIDRT